MHCFFTNEDARYKWQETLQKLSKFLNFRQKLCDITKNVSYRTVFVSNKSTYLNFVSVLQ